MKELMRFDTDKYHQAIQQHTLERHIKKLDEMGFEYLGGYLSNKTPMQIRCKVCGTERTVTGDFIGRKDKVGRWNTVRCKHCLEKESRERRAEKEKQEEERKARRLLIATLRRDIKALANRREKASAFFFATCEECGEEFITDKKKKYCSQRCANRRNNRVLWQNREKRIRDALVDKDISLEKVYKKDKGICYLCGEVCDWNDYTMQGDTFIAGNRYPSIEHVKPLSKGGEHSWKNVRLAHRWCNAIKSNTANISPFRTILSVQ